ERISELSAEAEEESLSGINSVLDDIKNLNISREIKPSFDRTLLAIKGLTQKSKWQIWKKPHYRKELKNALEEIFKQAGKSPYAAEIVNGIKPVVFAEIDSPAFAEIIPIILLLIASIATGMPLFLLVAAKWKVVAGVAFAIISLILGVIGMISATLGEALQSLGFIIFGILALFYYGRSAYQGWEK
ncbi:TPA: hypothetical protein H1005_00725, partial [archaeon]|nr:hypothetical protein [Candidatus Naiadarchaeales archaeon SRR2090153.bin1042]